MGFIFNKEITCQCGTVNPSDSRFCKVCGKPLISSSAMNTCPNCGAKIKSGVNFCNQCGTNLTQSPTREATVNTSKELNKNNIWMRKPDDFAQRFELSDINGVFTKIVTVEQGTGALFIQGGVYKGMLPAGQYNVEKLHQRIIGLVTKLTTTVILVDSGQVPITFSFGKTELRTKDAFEVGASGQLTVKIDDEHPLNFLENYLKGKNSISLTDIENNLHNELAQILRNTLSGYKISELYGNAEISRNIEEKLKDTLNERLKSKGLKIIYLDCIGFDDEAYQKVQMIKNKLNSAIETARLESNQRIEEAKIEYEEDTVIDNLDTSQQINTNNNETAVNVNKINNTYLETAAEQQGKHNYEDIEQGHQIKRDEIQQGARHIYENNETQHNLDTAKVITQAQLDINGQIFDQKLSQSEKILELENAQDLAAVNLWKQYNEVQDSSQRNEIENLNSASIETLIFLSKDSKKSAELVKLELSKRGLSEEQILAFQAADSPEVAKAIAAKYSANEQREFNRRTEAIFRENADRIERVSDKSLDAMGKTSTARATAHNPGTTVVSGGIGAPVVVNPSPQNTKKCKKCGASLDEDAIFCNDCGEKQD